MIFVCFPIPLALSINYLRSSDADCWKDSQDSHRLYPWNSFITSKGYRTISGKGYAFKVPEDFMSSFLCLLTARLDKTCFVSRSQTTTTVCAEHLLNGKPQGRSWSRSPVVSWSYQTYYIYVIRLNRQTYLAPPNQVQILNPISKQCWCMLLPDNHRPTICLSLIYYIVWAKLTIIMCQDALEISIPEHLRLLLDNWWEG